MENKNKWGYAPIMLVTAEVFLIGLLNYFLTRFNPGGNGHFISLDVLYCIPIIQSAHWASLMARRRSDTHVAVVVAVAVASAWSIGEAALIWPDFPPSILALNVFTRSVVFTLVGRIMVKLWRDKKLARMDSLTGLANRAELLERLDLERNRSERNRQPYSLLLIDIDNFKAMNDQFGHIGGDTALNVTADLLRRISRRVDVPARFGGDEFVMLLPDTGNTACEALTARMQAEAHQVFAERSWPISLSIGRTTHVGSKTENEQVLQLADEDMYVRKKARRQPQVGGNLCATLTGP